MTKDKMQSFDEYEKNFQANFSWLERKYYYTSMLVDQILRNQIANRNKKVTLKIRFLIKKSAYAVISDLFNFMKSNVGDAVWIGNLGRFPFLKRELAIGYKVHGYQVLSSHNSGIKNLVDSSYKLQNKAVSSISILFFFMAIYVFGTKKVLSNDAVLKLINKVVERKCKKISCILKKSKVRCLVELDDQMPDKRILAEAAKISGASYYVFAHGYFVDKYAISVLPIRADKLLVWCSSQFEQIISQYETNKVEVFGFPYIDQLNFSRICRRQENSEKVLIVLPFLEDEYRAKVVFDEVRLIINTLNMPIVIKLHPHNKNLERVSDMLDAECMTTNVELGPKELSGYSFVIGGASSALFAAKMLGLKVIGIKDWSDYEIKEVNSYVFKEFIENHLEIMRSSISASGLIYKFQDKAKEVLFD